MYRVIYSDFINATNLPGSGKADSYVRALDLLSQMLQIESFEFQDCTNIWQVSSLKRLSKLRKRVISESRKGEDSTWYNEIIPSSYLLNGYCSAALSSYTNFLGLQQQEDSLVNLFESHQGDVASLIKLLDVEPFDAELVNQSSTNTEGIDVFSATKTRLNQSVFRRMISSIYSNSCCITGLNIPAINRASHIIPWAKDKDKRLDPTNGLYLSATYDAAFDKHLISLDNDYRIILSKSIAEFYTRESVKEYFKSKEGAKVSLPKVYLPNKKYLAKHRSADEF